MTAVGQANLAQDAVDRRARHGLQRPRDLTQERRHQCSRWREDSNPLARERRVDREGDQDRALAPSPAGHQCDAPMFADEGERLDLRWMQRRLGQDDRAAGRFFYVDTNAIIIITIDGVRKPANEQGAHVGGLAGLPALARALKAAHGSP